VYKPCSAAVLVASLKGTQSIFIEEVIRYVSRFMAVSVTLLCLTVGSDFGV
jgi:hypothetical protein